MAEEQLQQQVETVGTSTEVIEKVEQEHKLDDLPRIETLRKSEKEVNTKTEIEGTAQIDQDIQLKDKMFVRKADQKKALYQKRIKIVTAVYTTALVLLLSFVIVNFATMKILKGQVENNTEVINGQNTEISEVIDKTEDAPIENQYQISLNPPRDYSEDKQELTFLDKLTILFRNLFA